MCRVDEIVHVHLVRVPLGTELAAAVLVRADQLTFLRVYRDGGLVCFELAAQSLVDMLELSVA